jgi:hypothetical protein
MERLSRVEARANHRLYVEFDDGASGVVDLTDRLFGAMFEPLQDENLFRQVSIDAGRGSSCLRELAVRSAFLVLSTLSPSGLPRRDQAPELWVNLQTRRGASPDRGSRPPARDP